MSRICPEHCDLSPLSESDPRKRATKVLVNADKMGCRKFVTPDHIVNGNSQLNLAFTALLFNSFPCLEMPVQAEVTIFPTVIRISEGVANSLPLKFAALQHHLLALLRRGALSLSYVGRIAEGCLVFGGVI